MKHLNLFRFAVGFALVALLATLAPTAIASPPVKPLADGYLTGCTGEYFNNTSLFGAPILVRNDASVNFFWREGTSPAPGINIEYYSVRWSCTVYASATGDYTFTLVTDDGMNLIVDGNVIIWAWYDQGPTTYSKTINLSAGAHTVRIEYYNRTLGGTAQVSSSLSGGTTTYGDWRGDYFNNQTLSGSPALTRNDAGINFNWTTGSPDASIPWDHFSVRWTRSAYFNAGTWRFTVTADDGVRVWVDGNLIIDKWFDQPATTYYADISLAASNHDLKVEYYENAGAAFAQLSYAPTTAPPPGGAWHGQYFNNPTLSGSPVLVRDTEAVNFDWGAGSPDPSVPVDNFSAKWDTTQNLPTSMNYTIIATSDDGVRVWIDGTLVIDAWYDHPPTTFTATRFLNAGSHNIHVEYYERGGGAMVRVQIGGVAPPPIGEVIVDDGGPGWRAGGRYGSWRNASAGIGGHAFWTYNNSYAASNYNWAQWFPTLPAAGNYEVFAYLPGRIGTTLYANYWIYHNYRYNIARRSQGFYAEQWLSLGTYYFNALGGEFALLTDVTNECYLCRTVVFDAVKFSPR